MLMFPFLGTLWVIVGVTATRYFQRLTVCDDGDSILVIKRRKQFRIPLSAISRVSYKKAFACQSVVLKFFEPCELGSEFEFQVSAKFVSPAYNEIADDLHRRSRCCRELADHGSD